MRLLQVLDQVSRGGALLVFLHFGLVEALGAVHVLLVHQLVVLLQVAEVLPHAAGRFVPVVLFDGEVIHVAAGDQMLGTGGVQLVRVHSGCARWRLVRKIWGS